MRVSARNIAGNTPALTGESPTTLAQAVKAAQEAMHVTEALVVQTASITSRLNGGAPITGGAKLDDESPSSPLDHIADSARRIQNAATELRIALESIEARLS